MATKPRQKQSAAELKLEIARSRDEVARDLRGLRYELDIPRRIRRSFREQTTLWVGAAAVVGTLIILLPLRRKKLYVDAKGDAKPKRKRKLLQARFALGVLRLAATLLK